MELLCYPSGTGGCLCSGVRWGRCYFISSQRDNLDVLFPYCDSYLGSCFLLGPDRGQLLSLSFSLSSTISLVQSFQMKNELFLNIDAERIHWNKKIKRWQKDGRKIILIFHMCSELCGPLQQYSGLKESSRDDIVGFLLLLSVELC